MLPEFEFNVDLDAQVSFKGAATDRRITEHVLKLLVCPSDVQHLTLGQVEGHLPGAGPPHEGTQVCLEACCITC